VPVAGGVLILPIGAVDAALLDYLAFAAGDALGRPARASREALAPDFAYDPVRRQVHSTRLIERLERDAPAGDDRLLGVTEADLFIPIFTFVFGEARLGGRAAVMSTARLRDEFHGRPAERRLLFRRAEKEALHELGHVFGLVHCPDFACVMHFSSGIEEVDLKGDRFCASCASRLPG
jgi:archaemetzincin